MTPALREASRRRKAEIVRLRAAGMPVAEIAARLGCSGAYVSQITGRARVGEDRIAVPFDPEEAQAIREAAAKNQTDPPTILRRLARTALIGEPRCQVWANVGTECIGKLATEAFVRGIEMPALVRKLLETITRDRLVRAVLDDEPSAPKKRRR